MIKDCNRSLKNFNSFAVDVHAQKIILLESESHLRSVLDFIHNFKHYMVIGGGSNILFVDDFPGLIIVNKLTGKRVLELNSEFTLINVAAGENWHDFVRWTLSNNFYGLENLSLIPGTVGAAPVQNIGAYGVELDQFFVSLQAIDLTTGKPVILDKNACQFAYRDSLFKSQLDRYLITSVNFKLKKTLQPVLHYAGISERLAECGMNKPTGLQISDAICNIRNSKLPLPDKIGNAGSFFKNPTISNNDYAILKSINQTIPAYQQSDDQYKIPAAWLIEQCGWKGYRDEDVGVHVDHALVLVNYGAASGRQIWQLANTIKDSVNEKFGIELEPEPRIIHAT